VQVAEEAANAADADADATGTDLQRLGKVVATLQRQLETAQQEARAVLEDKGRLEAALSSLSDQNTALEAALRERAAAAAEATTACADARAVATDAVARVDAASRGREEKDALLRDFMAATRSLEAEKGALQSSVEQLRAELLDAKSALSETRAQLLTASDDAAAAREEAMAASAAAEAVVWTCRYPLEVQLPPGPTRYWPVALDIHRSPWRLFHILRPGAKSCFPIHCFAIMLSLRRQSVYSEALGIAPSPNLPMFDIASCTRSVAATVNV
jgi:hypothetical protein